jgi:hypothetical protein
MAKKHTIPAFNPADIPGSIVTIPRTSNRLKAFRVTGAALVLVHATKPTTEAEHLEGWPLGHNATTPLLGEALPMDFNGGAQSALYVTAISASEVRVIELS